MFLECKVCQSGYKLNDGQCYKECNTNLGFSMAANGTCLKCADQNCVNCSTDANVCLKCNILYALSNGTCLRKRLINFRELPSRYDFGSSIIFRQRMLAKRKDSLQRVFDKQLQIEAIFKMRRMHKSQLDSASERLRVHLPDRLQKIREYHRLFLLQLPRRPHD